MTSILHIDSSAEGLDTSYSRRISAALVQALVGANPDMQVNYRDVAASPPPHIDASLRAAWMTAFDQRSAALVDVVSLSENYIAELKAADVIVIGSPMYNFTIPTVLKAWIDHVLIAGQTFRYTSEGTIEGLVHGKKAYLALARGGVYSEGPAAAFEYQESYLRSVLGFIGITDVEVVRVEGVAFGPDQARGALETALVTAARVVVEQRVAA